MDHTPRWQKSTFSDGGEGDTCVELTVASAHLISLRESDTPTAVLTTTTGPMTHLLRAIATGRLTQRRP
ncbi:DUF397 domain-containing protein [Streptomyces phaeolivaceus]|uniref:DUF397 domain-containing protein n=1 Tax=Streptomyces phaeolivaceus TaxID=2653200 RepID=A0A5P8K5E0_9ACTN|nr:DUF397 domain-containing protein [Streptomyces phaeolivaceus]QFQ97998.1 DUF397 domain-containing protein [Streptomyces phaeolivaceus]